MQEISFYRLKAEDVDLMELIASWYKNEWKIEIEKSINNLSNFPKFGIPFQIVLKLDDVPIATGGLYVHVGLLDREPRFKVYTPWLALIYTLPEYRNNSYGALLCDKIQNISKELGFTELYLYTHTAESLYNRLGWVPFERLIVKEKNIVVMKKVL